MNNDATEEIGRLCFEGQDDRVVINFLIQYPYT